MILSKRKKFGVISTRVYLSRILYVKKAHQILFYFYIYLKYLKFFLLAAAKLINKVPLAKKTVLFLGGFLPASLKKKLKHMFYQARLEHNNQKFFFLTKVIFFLSRVFPSLTKQLTRISIQSRLVHSENLFSEVNKVGFVNPGAKRIYIKLIKNMKNNKKGN